MLWWLDVVVGVLPLSEGSTTTANTSSTGSASSSGPWLGHHGIHEAASEHWGGREADRLRPGIPPRPWGPQDLLPPDWVHALQDLPVTHYRHQRLLRAVGAAPRVPILRPACSRPRQPALPSPSSSPASPSAARPARRRAADPFRGDLRVATWNAQAFFAASDVMHDARVRYLDSLLQRSDAILVTEAHGTPGRHQAWTPPPGCRAWWSAGPNTATAGVGIVVQEAFLRRFDPDPQWEVLWPGRAARLALRGSDGDLDLIVTYFPTGNVITPTDLYGATPADLPHCTSFWALRARLRQRLADRMASAAVCLSVMGGRLQLGVIPCRPPD